MIDVENAQVLLVLQALGESIGTCLRDPIVIEEEHVEAHMLAQTLSKALNATIIDVILT